MKAGSSNREGIYRRVSVRMYTDEKFMRLSPVQPSGQSLFIYALTGPHTGPIPGVFVTGKAAMAETLGWDSEAFGEAFAEVSGEGLIEFDPKTRLWFIPNAIKHNMPANPNVVLSWRGPWSLLPECAARDRIAERLLTSLAELSEAFGKAFVQACGKPSPKHSAKQEAVNSDQEAVTILVAPKPQAASDAAAGKCKARHETSTAATWAAYSDAYLRRYSTPPVRNGMVNGQLARFVGRIGATEAPSVAAFYVTHNQQFYVNAGHAVGHLLKDAEKLRTEWATGRKTTATQARQLDQTQTNLSAFMPMLEAAREREEGVAHGEY